VGGGEGHAQRQEGKQNLTQKPKGKRTLTKGKNVEQKQKERAS
jgi:hypothetical protein